MKSIAKQVKESIPKLDMRVFDADIFLKEIDIPKNKKEVALKELQRLEKDKVIQRVTNGVYAQRRISRVTKKERPPSEDEIVDYYTKKLEGMIVGYDLYNRLNLSTQISKKKIVLSSNIEKKKRTINSVTVKKIDLTLDEKMKKIIEMLEVVENANEIQDFNSSNFSAYISGSVDFYDKTLAIKILDNMNYKKQTIYNLDKILNYFGKDSGLEKFLNKTSRYKENLAYETISSRGR